MSMLQLIAEDVLLASSASRVVIQLADSQKGLRTVAEAVRANLNQLRHDPSAKEVLEADVWTSLQSQSDILVQDDLLSSDPALHAHLQKHYGADSRLVAPVQADGKSVGVIVIHGTDKTARWQENDIATVKAATEAVLSELQQQDRLILDRDVQGLRNAAAQAVLDEVRTKLNVQRCTLRRDVQGKGVFGVALESRSPGVRALLGDFTIVQSGQPVVQALLAKRAQVVQNDSRNATAEPAFQTMLDHYGDMRAQIVTPVVRNDGLVGVLSIHQLGTLRDWTKEETQYAWAATELLGEIMESSLGQGDKK